GGGVEECVEFAGIGELDLDNPGVVRGGVDLVGLGLESLIDGGDGAGDGRVEVADGLDAFDGAEGLAGGDGVAYFRGIDVDDVAEGVLRVIGDADGSDVAFDRDPLMLAGIAEVCGISHGIPLSKKSRHFSVRRPGGNEGPRDQGTEGTREQGGGSGDQGWAKPG